MNGVWIVNGGHGLWVVRAENEHEALDVAYSGPVTDFSTTAREYGLDRDLLSAHLIEDGPAALLAEHYG